MEYTAEQMAVITARPANLLVSAAAGSGKTAVLTERIVRRVAEQELDVQHVLVVTFTEAAARQMRDKIEEKLLAARRTAQAAEQRQYLSRQLALLPASAISTIHAFCLSVIHNFYYLARDEQGDLLVEPGFGVLDSYEAELLLRQALDDWMDSQYEAIDKGESAGQPDRAEQVAAFYRLTDGFGDSRSDQPVRMLLLQLYHFLRSLPDYQRFALEKIQEAARAAADFSASRYCRTLLDQLRLRLDRAMTVVPDLLNMLDGPIRLLADPRRNEETRRHLQRCLHVFPELHGRLYDGLADWDEIRCIARPLENLSMPRASGRDPEDKRAFLELFDQNVAEAVCFLSGNCSTPKYTQHFLFQTTHLLNKTAAEIQEEIRTMLPAIEYFIQLLAGLDERYNARKRQMGVLDFSDFEHLALLILRQEEARRYYQERFQEIYVDEYQDTSSIQETILQAIGRGCTLMVGDIKQSIYRFRHARPQIFRAKTQSYGREEGGRLLTLNRNFRSVPDLLGTVNDVFSQLMSAGSAEIDYDHRHGLVPFRQALITDPEPPVQVLLLDRQSAESTDDEDPLIPSELNPYEKEALLVRRQLFKMHDKGYRWRDMVILARTRGILSAYREQLEAAGIPTYADKAAEIMDSPVLRLLEAALQLVDNRRQDIPLAAVMHGDIGPVSFSLDEMARIKLLGRHKQLYDYHEAVLAYVAYGTDHAIKEKISKFFSWLDHLRQEEQVLRVGELIGLLYSETGWLDRVIAAPNGNLHGRLLKQFQTWAEGYEAKRGKGLFHFVRYLENMRDQERMDLQTEMPELEADKVRLLTIHGSKGLEFPVVFLVGCGGRINEREQQEHILFSENLGIGFDYADPDRQIRYPTHLKLAMQEEIRAAGQAEELRLLYVAMTRAMNRLFLTGTLALDPEKGAARLWQAVQQARQSATRRLPDHLVRSAGSYLTWILMALARNTKIDLSFLAGSARQNVDVEPGRKTEPASADGRENSGDEEGMTGMDQPGRGWSLCCIPLSSVLQKAEQQQLERIDDGAGLLTGQDDAASRHSCQPEKEMSPELLYELKQRVIEMYRFDGAARTPLKLTVSELKRQAMPDDPDEKYDLLKEPAAGKTSSVGPLTYRGIDLSLHEPADPLEKLDVRETDGGARLGTILHTVFRYLDLVAARRRPEAMEVERQLQAMQSGGMLSQEEVFAVRPMTGAILRFIQSPLTGEMAAAAKRNALRQEIPFTLALPAGHVYEDQSGLADDDQVMVQGIIDCWYQDESGITLVDYKSDYIIGDAAYLADELQRRYARQLLWYARAIQTTTGIKPRRCLIWHIRRGLAVPVLLEEG
ncbi:MAG: UvrD-helicase domain-containing protein [Ruminococcaceae bacterium]|nr:UvrD-helicase domain-containing protein [Oscillospiraceae bacterium]